MTSRVPVINGAVGLTALVFAVAFLAVGTASAAAPAPTAADRGMPNSIAVLGDSMSVATGINAIPSVTQPASSWATGTNSSVNSLYQRILALNPAINGNNHNLAANGEDMNDGPNQANSLPPDTELSTIQLGGNNLCKDSVAQMTTTAQYRSSLISTLNNLESRSPNGLILVESVPDIYNLWFLRGAPNPPNDQPSSRAGTARVFWDTLAVIPCKSLVLEPTSMAPADVARRDAVRARNIEYNQILAEECEARLRCRFDRYQTFTFSSNRASQPSGPYLPRANWGFVDNDISTVDHFHPGLSGQRKMAEAAWTSGYDFTDSTMPTSTATVSPAPLASGVSFLPSSVSVTWSDAAGIKGVQYRVHQNGGTGAWQTQMGTTTGPVNTSQPYGYLGQKSITVSGISTVGSTYVESRAMDVNGNLSASRITEVNYDPAAVPAPSITSKPPTITASKSPSFGFSGAVSGTTYECSLDGAPFTACTTPNSYSGLADGNHQFRVRLKSSSLNTGPADSYQWEIDSSAPPSPVISEGPQPNTKLTVANFIFAGDSGLPYECSLDGSEYTACSSPRLVNVPADGLHTFRVRQRTLVGVPGSPANYQWTVDNTAPEPPTFGQGPDSPTNATTASIPFSGEPGGTFRCQLDGGAVNICTSPRSLTGLGEGAHTLQVYQRDALNNQSQTSSFTWTVDLTPPAAPSIGSGPPTQTTSRSASVGFTGEPGGSFECALDDASFFICSSPRELSGLDDGPHQLRMRQIDSAGNVGPAASRSWTVDGTPPEAPTLSGGPASPTGSPSATFEFSGEPGGSFQCSLDGAAFANCTSPRSISGLGSGTHEFRVRQTDALGNEGEASSSTWTVDRTPPDAPVVGGLSGGALSDLTQPISFSGEPGGAFECRIGTDPWAACSSPWTATFPGEGSHRFEIRQTDALGNVGPAATGSLTFDLPDPPPPVITSSPSGTVRSTSAEVRFTLAQGASGECRLNEGAWGACGGSWQSSGLGQGPQKLEVRQSNPNGTSPAVSAEWAVDTVAPKLIGKAKAKAKGKAKKGKSRAYQLTTAADPAERPARLEFSIAAKKPSASAAPAAGRTRTWAPKLTIKSKKKLTWVRLFDDLGNASGWSPVRQSR